MVGQTLGRYRILRKLGAGGMGEVYLAVDTDLDRRIALKVLPEAMARHPDRLRRFKREAKTLASLNHPNIVTIYTVETVNELNFLTMEYLEGRTLTDTIPRGGVSLKTLFTIAIPLTDALAAAHDQGVIHRDLKPGNVMVTDKGRVKVLDFGLAKQQPDPRMSFDTDGPTETLTGEGHVLGTVPYMSPEQLMGRSLDHRTDIFSLGIILYQMATGERPFKGATSAEVQSSILRDVPEPADSLNAELPHHVARMVGLCLEKDPDARLQSARDVRNELSVLKQEISSGESRTRSGEVEGTGRRSSVRWVLLTALLVLLAGIGGWRLLEERRTTGIWPVGDEAQALLDQAELYELRGATRENLSEAEGRYRRAMQLEPDNPVIQARLAALLTDIQSNYPTAERPREIRTLAEAALQIDADNIDAWVALGYLSLTGGELDAAERAARRALETDPADPDGYTLLGQTLVKRGQVEPGLMELRKAVDLAGADTRHRLTLAWVLAQLGRQNEAAAEYENVLQYAPDSPTALNNLGTLYGRQGRYLDAIPLLKRLPRIHQDPEAAYNLANCYFFLDRLEEATATYLEVLELDPEHTWAPHGLAETYEKLGDQESARRYFERALTNYDRLLEASGPDATTLGTRAVVAAKLGRFDESIDDIETAESLSPDLGVVLFNAAQVYALTGDQSRAYRYIESAITAGYPRQEFEKDLAFAGYRTDPDFLELLETGVSP